jgi:hypothetical protein
MFLFNYLDVIFYTEKILLILGNSHALYILQVGSSILI